MSHHLSRSAWPMPCSAGVCVLALLLSSGCTDSQRATPPAARPDLQAPGPSVAREIWRDAERTGPKPMALVTLYQYDDGPLGISGIAIGCKAMEEKDGKPVGDPVVIASGAEIEESAKGPNLIKVKIAYMEGTREKDSLIAWFRPLGERAYVVKTLMEDRYESTYTYKKDMPGLSIPNIETRDLKTGEVVQTCTFQKILPNSNSSLFCMEEYFEEGKVVSTIYVTRQGGTGFCQGTEREGARIRKDYHNYEFVIGGWPAGRSPVDGGFGGASGGRDNSDMGGQGIGHGGGMGGGGIY